MPLVITSLQNPKIKNLVKLRQRRQRDRQGLMLIDGIRALRVALQVQVQFEMLYIVSEHLDPQVQQLAAERQVPLQPVTEAVFQKIGYGDNPDGHLGVAIPPNFSLSALPPAANPLYLVAEGLEKPGNLGAILRSADAAGVDGVLICNNQTDLTNPNIIRASQGAFFMVPLAVTPTLRLIDWLLERNVQILAATPAAEQPYTACDLRRPTALVVGAEHSGLSPAWLNHTRIHIPMAGQIDSLNVAQTATILMFEARRQRGASS
jgi:TrmH family RNA methyltransferase